MAILMTGYTDQLTRALEVTNEERTTLTITLTPSVTMTNDFSPFNPFPGSHWGARSWSISTPVFPDVGHFLKLNPYCKLLFVSCWALMYTGKWTFSP